MANTPTAPVFRQMKTHSSLLGYKPSDLGKLAIVIAIGVGLYFLFGLPTHAVIEDRPAKDIAADATEYTALRTSAAKVESAMEKYGASDPSEVDLPSDILADYETAKEMGITGSMGDAEMQSLIPTRQVVAKPIVPDVARAIVLVLLPAIIFLAVNKEVPFGSTPVKEAKRLLACKEAQHVYISNKRAFLEEAENAQA